MGERVAITFGGVEYAARVLGSHDGRESVELWRESVWEGAGWHEGGHIIEDQPAGFPEPVMQALGLLLRASLASGERAAAACPACGARAEMVDRAPEGESGDVVRCSVRCDLRPRQLEEGETSVDASHREDGGELPVDEPNNSTRACRAAKEAL